MKKELVKRLISGLESPEEIVKALTGEAPDERSMMLFEAGRLTREPNIGEDSKSYAACVPWNHESNNVFEAIGVSEDAMKDLLKRINTKRLEVILERINKEKEPGFSKSEELEVCLSCATNFSEVVAVVMIWEAGRNNANKS